MGQSSDITGHVFSTNKYPARLRPRLPYRQRTSALTWGSSGHSRPPHQHFKGRCVLGGELKPGQEVEGLSEVTPVVQPPRDLREVLKPGGDVMGAFLEDPPPFVLRQIPPRLGLSDRNQRCPG